MKPARFILNTDYTTSRNMEIYTPSITIPDEFTYTIPFEETYIIGRIQIPKKSKSNSFSVYFSSSRFDYDSYGSWGNTKPEGAVFSYVPTTGAYSYSDLIGMRVVDRGDKLVFEVYSYGSGGATFTYEGYGQTITAHILTFKDPFSA